MTDNGETCGICEYDKPICNGISQCTKGHYGVFRLMVTSQGENCPDFEILKSIVSVTTGERNGLEPDIKRA